MSTARSTGFMHRLVPRVEGLVLIQFLLLVLALISIGDGLANLITGIASNPTLLFALLGTFTGWQLARSGWNAWRSAGITLLTGVVVLLLTVGGLTTPLWGLVAAIFTTRPQLSLGRLVVDPSRIAAAWSGLGGTLGGIVVRLTGWFQLVGGKSVAHDPLVIGLLWGLTLWLLAGWAAWMVRRRSAALPALLPGTALLAWASFFTNSRQSLIPLLLVGAELVALQVIQSYQSSRRHWLSAGLTGIDILPGPVGLALGLSLVLVIVGALTPSISIKQTAESIDTMFAARNDRLARSLGLQPTPRALVGQDLSASSTIYNSHNVGAGPKLSPDVVMTVAVDGYQPIPETATVLGNLTGSPIRYYWRSQTFDHYLGYGWTVTTDRTAGLEADQPLSPGQQTLPGDFLLVTQHVTRNPQGQAVLVTGELLALDQPATVTWRSPDDFVGAITQSNSYIAESRVSLVTVETLRQAGSDYPQQIRQYYLQLPDELPARVRNLAFEITANQADPYDKAAAIEAFLRQYPYTLEVPAPPAGRDLADYFLFDLQQGYCDYYASTMVVLARAVGIPARLVLGYSRGSYDAVNGTFIVRADNAHAWVDVYFPGDGWIEFEPTANQPEITRLHAPNAPLEVEVLPVVPAPPKPSAFLRLRHILEIHSGWLVAAMFVLLLALLIPLEGWLLLWQKPDRALDIIQHRLYRLGHHWKVPRAGALTPYEFSAALAERLETFAKTRQLSVFIAAIQRDLDWQTGLYVRSLYAGRPPTRLESRRAVHAWLGLKRHLWWLQLRFWRKT
jgi:transglutaminase-like putative cysteine protease